ncbi:MAG: HD-GYP domain-containing protein [Candidatus Omnitrophica bacterium]|nr:HD-GYP domain-containing protein [Candidatus Omnitrophota bacterium]MBU1933171.1 HD-GYP domain-containing protein [Candidatus Omnitrophota bacterium]
MSKKLYYQIAKALILALEARAYCLKGHSYRVTKYALEIAKSLELPRSKLKIMSSLGKLHDLGKIALSDAILNKNGPLTKAERLQINLHPVIGSMILKNLGFVHKDISIVRNHHERYDGRGYPDGLKKEKIPLLARIFTVADAFDAMTSDRPYRKSLPLNIAIDELLRNRGTQFDPRIVEVFIPKIPR